jgi:hypothetical protein
LKNVLIFRDRGGVLIIRICCSEYAYPYSKLGICACAATALNWGAVKLHVFETPKSLLFKKQYFVLRKNLYWPTRRSLPRRCRRCKNQVLGTHISLPSPHLSSINLAAVAPRCGTFAIFIFSASRIWEKKVIWGFSIRHARRRSWVLFSPPFFSVINFYFGVRHPLTVHYRNFQSRTPHGLYQAWLAFEHFHRMVAQHPVLEVDFYFHRNA